MSVPTPHFLLLAGTRRRNERDEWRFVLQAADGSTTLSAQEFEADIHGERLELLSVVRGLEALEQPSRVTLVTPSRYVRRGFVQGLEEWRRNDWTWESFGEMVPVKNRDLWQRLDRALGYHRVEMRTWRLDAPHSAVARRPEIAAPAPHAITAPHTTANSDLEPADFAISHEENPIHEISGKLPSCSMSSCAVGDRAAFGTVTSNHTKIGELATDRHITKQASCTNRASCNEPKLRETPVIRRSKHRMRWRTRTVRQMRRWLAESWERVLLTVRQSLAGLFPEPWFD
jgi:ribonuclease HI